MYILTKWTRKKYSSWAIIRIIRLPSYAEFTVVRNEWGEARCPEFETRGNWNSGIRKFRPSRQIQDAGRLLRWRSFQKCSVRMVFSLIRFAKRFHRLYSRIHALFVSLVQRYHLKDVIVGKIYFLLVRIKIKYMELAIVKRETTGSGRLVFAAPPCDTEWGFSNSWEKNVPESRIEKNVHF